MNMSNKKVKKKSPSKIAVNKKASLDYFIEETLEAGIMLEGREEKTRIEGKDKIN